MVFCVNGLTVSLLFVKVLPAWFCGMNEICYTTYLHGIKQLTKEESSLVHVVIVNELCECIQSLKQ